MRRLLSWLMRRWLLVALIIAFVVFAILNFDELAALAAALVRGEWQWVLGAALAQVGYYLVYAVQYKYAFATVEVESRALELLPVMFASIFVKTVVPSAGISGAAVFVDDAARRGQSGARAAEGALLVLILDLATLVPLLLAGLAFLGSEGALFAYQVVGSAIFLAFIGGLIAALLLGRWQPRLLHRAFLGLQQAINRIGALLGRPHFLPAGWAAANAADFIRAANDVATHRRDLGNTAIVASVDQVFNVISLDAVGRAYPPPLGLGAVVAAFSLEALFSVVAITPNGLIVAEAVMVTVLASLGVSLERAILITVVYRGLSVWLPLAVGFLFLRYVRSFQGRRRP